MQGAYTMFNALGYLSGDKSIIYGCTATGSNTGDGFVFIGGELLPFIGSTTQATVKIIEETTSKEFQDGTTKVVHRRRYVTFATGSNTIPWADFKRGIATTAIQNLLDQKATNEALTALTNRVTTLEKYSAPFASANGAMVLWRKPANEIPAGWQEVVDWRGRLAVGQDPNDVDLNGVPGTAVGSKKKTLVAANIPPITMKIPRSSANTGGGGDQVVMHNLAAGTYLQISTQGTASAFSVLNPARIVLYIEPIPEE